jgi:hypothetical protein
MKHTGDKGMYRSNLIFIRHVKGPRRVTTKVEQGRTRKTAWKDKKRRPPVLPYLYRHLEQRLIHALRKQSGVPPGANQRAPRPCIFANLPLESLNVRMAALPDHPSPQKMIMAVGVRPRTVDQRYTAQYPPAGGYPLLTHRLGCTLCASRADCVNSWDMSVLTGIAFLVARRRAEGGQLFRTREAASRGLRVEVLCTWGRQVTGWSRPSLGRRHGEERRGERGEDVGQSQSRRSPCWR